MGVHRFCTRQQLRIDCRKSAKNQQENNSLHKNLLILE